MGIVNHNIQEILGDLEKGDAFREKGDVFQEKDKELGLEDQSQSMKTPSSQEAADAERVTENATPKQIDNVMDWDGPNDPDNPQNWPMSKRVYHAVVPALFGFAV